MSDELDEDLPTKTPAKVSEGVRKKGVLEKPWIRQSLIRELAQSEKQRDLATKYGVTEGAITQFKTRHALRIEEVRQNLDDEFAGLWIAKKQNRIEIYQNDLEMLEIINNPDNIKIKTALLKGVAEELGQLPPKVNVQVNQPITYHIEGVDPDELK